MIDALGLVAIKNFIQRFSVKGRIYIPDENLDELIELFRVKLLITLNFRCNNPLSVMETVTLALSLVIGPGEISGVLMREQTTIKTFISRAKIKLGADTKSYAIYESMTRGYFNIAI